jgi:hypothetical protein
MKARRQVCLNCRQDFTRKWNAQRHNKHAHAGAAKILSTNSLQYGKVFGEAWTSQENLSPSYNEEAGQNRLFDILEGIGKEFEECDRLLQEFPIKTRQETLGWEVYNAISSNNPKRSMKSSLESIRRGMMIACVAKAMNQASPAAAEKMLNSIVDRRNYR